MNGFPIDLPGRSGFRGEGQQNHKFNALLARFGENASAVLSHDSLTDGQSQSAAGAIQPPAVRRALLKDGRQVLRSYAHAVIGDFDAIGVGKFRGGAPSVGRWRM